MSAKAKKQNANKRILGQMSSYAISFIVVLFLVSCNSSGPNCSSKGGAPIQLCGFETDGNQIIETCKKGLENE